MIILNLKDGLGNQFFEYAYALCLHQMYPNDKIWINPIWFRKAKNRYRQLAISNLLAMPNVQYVTGWKQYYWFICFLIRLCICLNWRVIYLWKRKDKLTHECIEQMGKMGLYVSFNPFEFYDIKTSKCRIKYIYGNFEHKNYVEPVKKLIKADFKINLPNTAKVKDVITQINASNSVCVHIRRGDYLDPQWAMLNVCNFAYYERGMQYVNLHIESPVFFVFSNTAADIEWIKQNYAFSSTKICYIALGLSDFEEFCLMAQCKHFIISNSTFSWWASQLSDHKGKIVISPSQWSKTQNVTGLYLDDFVCIGNENLV